MSNTIQGSESERLIKADLHTHTVGSGHGFSTVNENVAAAKSAGLELIAITDHGPAIPQGAHNWYFWNLSHVPGIFDDFIVLRGCEANITTDARSYESTWGLDVADIVTQRLDYVTIGFHPTTGYDDKNESKNTAALIKALQSPFVDQLNHPGNLGEFPFNVDAVIEAAVENNVIIEINNSSFNPLGVRVDSKTMELDFALKAYRAGAKLSINSDAHHSAGIGRVEPALDYVLEAGIPLDAFVNTSAQSVIEHIENKRPRPLFAACKKKHESKL